MTDTASHILKSSLGTELTHEEADVIGGLMKERNLEDGDFLIEEGGTDDSLHVLLEGKVEVVRRSGGGDLASIAILRRGDLAGELSFIDGAPHTVGLRALGDCHVASLHRKDFEALIDKAPHLVYKVLRSIVRSAHHIVHRMNLEFIELSNYIFKQHGRY